MKNARQEIILKIIEKNGISTQQQLLEALMKEGVAATQASISRDIKELRIRKVVGENGIAHYKRHSEENASKKLYSELHKVVVSLIPAQNLVVIKTYPGMANAVAAALDRLCLETIKGTIAGDDTIFVAMETVEEARKFCESAREEIGY